VGVPARAPAPTRAARGWVGPQDEATAPGARFPEPHRPRSRRLVLLTESDAVRPRAPAPPEGLGADALARRGAAAAVGGRAARL